MTTRTKTPSRTRKTYVRDLDDGLTLKAEISPCVFMYPGYPLQLTVTLLGHAGKTLAEAHVADRTKTANTYTGTDVRRLLSTVRIRPCSECSSPTFDHTTVKTNRGELCESCFRQRIEAELEVLVKAEEHKVAQRDRRQKRKGMIVRVTAWIHPEAGGSDYQMDWYFNFRPTEEEVRDVLRGQGSCVLDDYQIITL